MSEFIKPYNNDPFVGNLSTPVTTSTATKLYLGNLAIYRKGLSPLLRGLEIGMAHGYFLIGPFYILGPLRNSENALLVGFTAALGLILVLIVYLKMNEFYQYLKEEENLLLLLTVVILKYKRLKININYILTIRLQKMIKNYLIQINLGL